MWSWGHATSELISIRSHAALANPLRPARERVHLHHTPVGALRGSDMSMTQGTLQQSPIVARPGAVGKQ